MSRADRAGRSYSAPERPGPPARHRPPRAVGGDFNLEEIRHFDGNLFADAEVLELTGPDLVELGRAARLDWANIDPSIFGTPFERGMDSSKRSQLGAHYTSHRRARQGASRAEEA
jgi:hypothetical protein